MVSLWCTSPHERKTPPRQAHRHDVTPREDAHVGQRHPGHRSRSRAAVAGRACRRAACLQRPRHRHRPRQVDRVPAAAGARAAPARPPRRRGQLRGRLAVRPLRQQARADRRPDHAGPAEPGGARRGHRRDRQPRDRPRQHRRPDRPDRRDLPARHDQLGRRRGPAHCSALGKVFYASGALPLPTRGLERRTAPHHHRPRRPRQRDRDDPSPGVRRNPRRARDRARRHRRTRLRHPATPSSRRSASPVRATGSATSFRSSPSC